MPSFDARRTRGRPVLRQCARHLASLAMALAVTLMAGAGPVPGAGPFRPARAELGGETAPVLGGRPIWPQGTTSSGAVALFRKSFDLPPELVELQLSIIADTRYEVWLDGQWLGRGPARFSRVRQEFDTLALGDLQPGPHLLAVLAQYAPNTRRSESLHPALQASVRGWAGSDWQMLVATGTAWKATVSPAWDAEAAPVSRLQLIGPMEILDLRGLPPGWLKAGFDDSAWPPALEVLPTPFPALMPRTIAALHQIMRLPVAVVESGLLSPGWQLVDLEVPEGSDAVLTLSVTASQPTQLRLEALDAGAVTVDNSPPLAWTLLDDARRPDVLEASAWVSAGVHTLAVAVPGEGIYAEGGRSLAIYLEGLAAANLVSQPSHDPGRRTLLANPVPGGAGAPEVRMEASGAEVTVPVGSGARYLVLDFDRTLHGRLVMEAEGPAGTIIDAGWDERLTEGRTLPDPGSLASNLWSQIDTWILDGTQRSLTTIDTRSGRYLLLQIWGAGPVRLHRVHVQEELYPVEQSGSFTCSDPLLNTIWQVGVDSLRPNMTDAYTDTPWRERAQWWGDAMIAYYANRATFGDLGLLGRGLRQMADAIDADGRPPGMVPNWPGGQMLDFGMLWIEGLYLYWTQSGDLELVAELYPAALRLVDFLASYEGAAGLLDVPPAHWSQSALIDWSAVSSRSGESTALNAQYSFALGQMSDMARALGDAGGASRYLDRSAAVRQQINDVMFLPEAGCYAASRLNGVLVPPSLHAQAWALRYQVVPLERQPSTVAALSRQLIPFFSPEGVSATEPLGMFTVLEGLAEGRATNRAMAVVRERYGAMLTQGATTWWELYTPNQTRGHSLSHAWGASPTWFLSSHVLGGVALGPATWRVAPHPGGLQNAQGSVPMRGDTLDVAWREPGCGEFQLTLTSPADTAGDVLLPVWRLDARVTMDDQVVWDAGAVAEQNAEMTTDGLLLSGVSGGKHEFLASYSCHSAFLPLACAESQIDGE